MTGAGRVGTLETPWRGLRRAQRPPGPWATPAVVYAVLSLVGADGHGVYALPAVAACGVPPALVAALATAHRGTPDAALRGPDGAPLGEVWGVHGLAILEALARELAVPVVLTHSWRLAAHYAAQALAAWLRAQDHPVPPLPPPPDLTAPSLPPPAR